MIAKLERLLDLLIRLLERELHFPDAQPGPAATPRRSRKATPPTPLVPALEPAKDIFAGIEGGGADDGSAETIRTSKPTPEQAAEAKRAAIEVMGLFIKKHLNAKPKSGQQLAREIMAEVCGRKVDKLDELTYEDHIKLAPRFNDELDKAAA